MTQRLAPIAFAAALLVVAVLVFRGRGGEGLVRGGSSGADERPQPGDTVFEMVQVAQRGDGDGYIGCFWGPLRTRLEQMRGELGTRGFADYLKESALVIKGVAVIGEPEPVGADMKVQAEMQYENKKEAQEFVLTRHRGRWLISEMASPSRVKEVIPYGAEAYPLLPPIRGEEQATESSE